MSSIKKSQKIGKLVEDIDINQFPIKYESIPIGKIFVLNDSIIRLVDVKKSDDVDLYNPIIVYKQGEQFIIVDGVKRFFLHQKNKNEFVHCIIIDKDLTDLEFGKLRIKLNIGRKFSIVEKINFLKWSQSHFDKSSVEALAELMNVSRKEIAGVAMLINVRKEIIDAVSAGKINIGSLPVFLLLSESDQKFFLKIFEEYNLTVQTQREFLEWLSETGFREGLSVQEIFAESKIKDIVDDEVLNWPQKIHKIRDILFARRFPMLNDAHKNWQSVAQKIKSLNKKIKLVPSTNYENNELEIKISVTNIEQIHFALKTLKNVSDKEWETLIYPVR